MNERFTSGLPGLDKILNGILPGDNVVLCIDDVEDYRAFVEPLRDAAIKNGRTLVYFRFADHPALLSPSKDCLVHQLDLYEGFEAFTSAVHRVIKETGRGAYYVFDCLSDLAVGWHSDQMLGNFFMLTCPYLFDMETLTYFGLFRGQHSPHALEPIRKTTQLFLDIYSRDKKLYILPSKVQHRYSATMNMLHAWNGNKFESVTASALISEILTSAKWPGPLSDSNRGFWDRAFIEANSIHNQVESGSLPPETEKPYFDRLARMIISRDERILKLVTRYLTLDDILKVRHRMIGTGLIGGKAVGMLLSRAILQKDPKSKNILESHDSFFIGSDEFYTYIVRNGIWWERVRQRDPENFYESATRARRLIITGSFSDETIKQFEEMLDYFGQSPFIVRSSSLLEDNFGNAFAGKYESVFCANRGQKTQRLDNLLAAIRTVYASTMSEKALRYRAQRGMLEKDEQMALLVMRVSGSLHGHNFYPPIAGVGFSFNPYVWDKAIDPEAGVLRLVFGLGTRAVDRSDDDYTRIVALNAPTKRPEHNIDQVRDYAQRRVDYLDLNVNQLVSGYFLDMYKEAEDLPMDLLVTTARHVNEQTAPTPILTFEHLLTKTDFVKDMRHIMDLLQSAYEYPVDIEFAANFIENNQYRINLLQCRPLQVRGTETVYLPKIKCRAEDRIIEAKSAVIGQSRLVKIDRFIYVVPESYSKLSMRDRYSIAELIGSINRTDPDSERVTCLLGPGRWGTSSPELGVPVHFSDISCVSILCEIAIMSDTLIPDVSLGTHFLNELVEMNMLYLALFPNKENSYMNNNFLTSNRNHLCELIPSASKWQDTIRIIETKDIIQAGESIMLSADAREQHVLCYIQCADA